MRAWRTLTDPSQLWRFPFCCRQPLAADPAAPPGDVPSLNKREIWCAGSQGCQAAEVSQSVWAACDVKVDKGNFLHLLPAGVFSFVSGSIKNPTEKKENAPSSFKDRFYHSNGLLCLPTAFSLVQLIKEPLPVPWAALPGYSLWPGGFAPDGSPELAPDPPLSGSEGGWSVSSRWQRETGSSWTSDRYQHMGLVLTPCPRWVLRVWLHLFP